MNETVIRVRDVMHQRFRRMEGLSTVEEAIREIRQAGAEMILVEKRHDGDELGIVLLSDIAKKVLGQNRAPDRVNLFEVMTKPIVFVRADMDVRYCARLFHNFGLSSAPVIDGEDVIGYVTYRELVLDGLCVEHGVG